MSAGFNKFIMAQLLYNALEVEMLFLTGVGESLKYESYEDVTFLSEILGLNKYEGRLIDNGYTSLTGKTELMPGVPQKYSPCPWRGEPRVCQGPEHNLVSAVALLPTDGALQTPASARNPDGPAPSTCRHFQQEQNSGFASCLF